MNYGMDVFEERVLLPVLHIADPVERLKACMEKNIHLVTEGWSKEVTIILHEHETLTGDARAQINARKKRYVRFLESSFAEAVREGPIRTVESDGGRLRVPRHGPLDLQVVQARREAHRRRDRRGHGGSAVHRPRAAFLTPFTKCHGPVPVPPGWLREGPCPFTRSGWPARARASA